MSAVHVERPWPVGVFFATLPALCGRVRPSDYRMFPPDDALHRKATRKFFADRRREVTCKACLRALQPGGTDPKDSNAS